ncbi:MAG: DNA polymerase IV [Firmicutes bacterium]|nr:DNA polymerase IV [Bacillota bacterium]
MVQQRDRVILHCDMNGFFASVELLSHPELQGRPMAVCGSPDKRHGIILAKNELAKRAGVVTAETVWQALKKCPDLQFVPPHMSKYKHYSRLINEIYQRFTDMVEPFSIDESWLDVTASQSLFGNGKEIADTIRETVKNELGLTLSAGVSFNKIFAKMGSEYKKPDATTIITRENYREILWPLPAGEMFFVGKATAQKLSSAGINTIGDIAMASPDVLEVMLGKQGRQLWKYTNGLDTSPVTRVGNAERIKSVGNGVTFTRDLITEDDIITAVTSLSDTVAGRLRKYGMRAYGVKVDIKDPYFKVISRQKQLFTPTNLASEISKNAIDIIHASWKKGSPIRMLTITGINLTDEFFNEQLSLFEGDGISRKKGEQIERTMDEVRRKYGNSSIGFATVIDNDIGAFVRGYTEEESEAEDNNK